MKNENKEYLRNLEELEIKLEGKDKEVLQLTIYLFNECARLLAEKEQRIDKAIEYMENYISVEEYNEPVKCEFKIIIRKLKGGKQ